MWGVGSESIFYHNGLEMAMTKVSIGNIGWFYTGKTEVIPDYIYPGEVE